MSKKKKLSNQLNALFEDLGKSTVIPDPPGESTSLGWNWETDVSLGLVSASPETKICLGYPPGDLTGKPLTEFIPSETEISDLLNLLREENFPAEIRLTFHSMDGQLVASHATVFDICLESGTRIGYHFIFQVIGYLDQQEKPKSSIRRGIRQEDQDTPEAYQLRQEIESIGFAIEGENVFPTSSPYTSSGIDSLSILQTMVTSRTADQPASISVPIKLPDMGGGLIEVIDDQPDRYWTDDEQKLIEQVADQLSLALENARLFQQSESRAAELVLVNRVVGQVASSLDLQTSLDLITRIILQNFPLQRVTIFIRELDHPIFTVSSDALLDPDIDPVTGSQIPLTSSFARYLSSTFDTDYLFDPLDQIEDPALSTSFKQSGSKSLLLIPLIATNEVIGTTVLHSSQDDQFLQQDQLRLVETIVSQATTAIQNAQLFEQTQLLLSSEQRRRQISDALSEIARVVGASLELEDVGQRLLEEMALLANINTATLEIVEGEQLVLISTYNPRRIGSTETTGPIPQEELVSEMIQTRRPILINDTRQDYRWNAGPGNDEIRSWLSIPMTSANEVIGLLTMTHTEPSAFDIETFELLSAVAAQASVAVRNARLFAQIQSRSVQLQTAAEVSRAATSILDPTPLIQQTVDLIRERFNLYYVGLFMIDQEGTWTDEPNQWAVLRAGTGDAGKIQLERHHKLRIGGGSMIGQAVESGAPVISQQVAAIQDRFANPLLPETRSELAIPLISRGRVIGAMTIQDKKAHAFSQEDIAVLQTMADQLANAILNASLFDQTQARAEELDILNQMIRGLTSSLDIQSIYQNIYQFTSKLIDTSNFFLSLIDTEYSQISFPIMIEENRSTSRQEQRMENGLIEFVYRSEAPLLIQDNIETWATENQVDIQQWRAKTWLGVPLTIGDRVTGIIGVYSDTARHFNEQNKDLLVAIANSSAIAIQNALLFEQTQTALSQTEALYKVSQSVMAAENIQDLLDTITSSIASAFDADRVSVYLVDPSIQEITTAASSGVGSDSSRYLTYDQLVQSEAGNVFQENKPVLIRKAYTQLRFGSQMIVPFQQRSQTLGLFIVENRPDQSDFSQGDLDLLQTMVSQAAVAIENLYLFNRTQQALDETATLYLASAQLNASQDFDDILHTLRDHTVFGEYEDTTINITNFDRPWTTDQIPVEIRVLARFMPVPVENVPNYYKLDSFPYVANNLTTKNPLVVEDIQHDTGLDEQTREWMKTGNFKSMIIVPLVTAGVLRGYIGGFFLERVQFTDDKIRRLTSLSGQAAVAIQGLLNLDLAQQRADEALERSRELEFINQLVTSVSATLVMEDGIRLITTEVGKYLDINTSVSIRHRETCQMLLKAIYDREKGLRLISDELNLALPNEILTVIETENQPVIIPDIASDIRITPHMDELHADNIRGIAFFPISVAAEIVGVLSIAIKEDRAEFREEDIRVASTVVLQTASLIHNARLYQEQLETAERLRELDTLKSQFLANMSHELRTPLNSIIGFSRVIMKGIDGPVTDLQDQDLRAIYSAGQHLLDMINDILDISKIEAGRMELAFEPVEIQPIVESVLSTARGLVKGKPIDLKVNIQEDLPIIQADPTRIRQILINLLSNAEKFTDEGSITVDVRAQANPAGEQEIYFAVTDTGIGIAEEDYAKLFQPFTQVDASPTRKTGGTGLGLSITNLLIEMHGGKIDFESNVGVGSTFYFTLPIANTKIDLPQSGEGNFILSIDDDPKILNLYQRYLSNSSIEVIQLTDAQQAVDYAKQHQPIAITLDVKMPGKDGWETLQELKNDPRTRSIPVIICSISDEQEKGYNLGANGYLTKPILEEEFVGMIQQVISGSKS